MGHIDLIGSDRIRPDPRESEVRRVGNGSSGQLTIRHIELGFGPVFTV